jgi:predicted O-methyltransferase YrrM
MGLLRRIARRLLRRSQPPLPVHARHVERSLIASADDDPGRPDDRLFDVALAAVQEARQVSAADVVSRMKSPPYYPDVWPGEHYKLLAGLVRVVKPRLVVEIGTSTGLSALTITHHLPPDGRLVTFDLLPWDTFPDTALVAADFADGRLKQELADLGERATFDRYREVIRGADLIFLDGPKDGVFEQRMLDHLGAEPLPANPLIVLDDIRVWNMLHIWRAVTRPKLDLTSFGHWSGTGLINWVSG